jgi:general stress protein 26
MTMDSKRCVIASLAAMTLALSALGLFSEAPAQEKEAAVPPRDSVIAIAKDIMEQIRFCILITLDESGHPRARAMDPFMPDENMVIRMGTGVTTRKVKEIKNDPRVTLYYDHPQNAGYVTVYGTARLVDAPEAKAKWFKEEWARFYPDRENYVIIEVKPERMEIVDYVRGLTGDPETWQPPSIEF